MGKLSAKYSSEIMDAFNKLDEYKYDNAVLEGKFISATESYEIALDRLTVMLGKVDKPLSFTEDVHVVHYINVMDDQASELDTHIKTLVAILNTASAKLRALRAAHIDREPLSKLTDDPLYAIRTNDHYRNGDLSKQVGLLRLSDYCAYATELYSFPVPTLIPDGWKSSAVRITQADYTDAFTAKFPLISEIFPIPNVVVCGGAAAWPLGDSNVEVGDIDLFIHSIDPLDMVALWQVVFNIASKIRAAVLADPNYEYMTEMLSPGLLTFVANKRSGIDMHNAQRALKIQIILRAFPSISGILHGFDVPSCCVAYDGRNTYMTYLSAYAHIYRVNVVNPKYRSTTYERRLVKYFGRGYAVAMPHMTPGSVTEKTLFVMPHIVIGAHTVVGNGMIGEFKIRDYDAVLSDYDLTANGDYIPSLSDYLTSFHCIPLERNLHAIAHGTRAFVMMGIRSQDNKLVDEHVLDLQYIASNPALSTTISRRLYHFDIRTSSSLIVDAIGRVDVQRLRKVFNADDEYIQKFSRAIDIAARSGKRINIEPTRRKLESAMLDKYDAAAAMPVDWWITTDPSRQYTASLNPRMENPAEWYGDCATDEKYVIPTTNVAATGGVSAALARLRMGTVFSDDCMICKGPLTRGETNSIILGCGHMFHWGAHGGSCRGFRVWVAQNEKCPVCRSEFDQKHPVLGRVLVPTASNIANIDV
jgi:hypothetical protein